MEIRINGQILDARIENEKTVGEVMSGIKEWLADSGHILSRLAIDGAEITAPQIEEAFKKEINTIKKLEIQTEALSSLCAQALINLLDDIKEYESLNFEEKSEFFSYWKESPQGLYFTNQMPDLFLLCRNTFEKGDILPWKLFSITEERLNEVNDPVKELKNIEQTLNEICEKLTELPLDIQTGKDIKAAQSIGSFSSFTEKVIRIFTQLDIQGYFEKGKEQIVQQFTSFNTILAELTEAYERKDYVLVGDIAEYEASVKIKDLYNSILTGLRGRK